MYYVKQNSGDKENKGFLATESEADVNLANIHLAYLQQQFQNVFTNESEFTLFDKSIQNIRLADVTKNF